MVQIVDSSSKVIAVIGATGAQGGGLARAITSHHNENISKPFTLRALTRDPLKKSALALKEAGADVVAFDMDWDAEKMAKALDGVYGIFVITNYWEHFDHEKEMAQAKAVVEAGEKVGVQHYVWSTLEDTVPFFESLSPSQRPPKVHGTYVPHFDSKGQANSLFPTEKTTILYTSFYLENFYEFGLVKNGAFQNTLGDEAELPVIAVEDIGRSVHAIFQAGDKYIGQTVHLAGDRMKSADLMALASEVTGEKFVYTRISRDEFANLGFPGADDLANMYEYFRLNKNYAEGMDPSETKTIYPQVQSAREWFKTHKQEMLSVGPAHEQ